MQHPSASAIRPNLASMARLIRRAASACALDGRQNALRTLAPQLSELTLIGP